jgi:hypothetical protein
MFDGLLNRLQAGYARTPGAAHSHVVDTYTIAHHLTGSVSDGRPDPTRSATHRVALDDTMAAHDTFADAPRPTRSRSCGKAARPQRTPHWRLTSPTPLHDRGVTRKG